MPRLDDILFNRHVDDDEEVVFIVHKHWVLGIKHLLWPSLSFFASWVFLYFAPFLAIFYIVALWSVISIVWWLRNFFDYYLDAWIITDTGIIDVAWHGWFHRESSRVLYSDVQGVSYEIQGVVGTMFRYGEVSVEKISTGNTISLDHVARPRKVESMVLKTMEVYLHSKNLKDAKHVQELLCELVANEFNEREVGENDGEDDDEFDDDDDV